MPGGPAPGPAPAQPAPPPSAGRPSTPAAGTGTPATPAPAAKAEKQLEITVAPEGVSIFAVAADAHEVLTQLGEATGLRIIIDDTVSRKITVRLSRRTPKEIVESIVAAYGLSASEVNGIFMISEGIPKNPSSYLLSDIDAIRTQYVLASTAKSLLPVFLQDHVKVNNEQNAVVLSGPREVLRKFRGDIQQFDKPASQIMIDVMMVELTRTGAREWALQLLEQSRHHVGVLNPATGVASLRTVIARLPSDFQIRLRALMEKGDARVHANPRIATVSGRGASIFIGKQRYISTPIDAPKTGQAAFGGQINFIDAGVSLGMVTYTGGEGEIIVDLMTEVSTMSAPDPVTGLPAKNTRQANTAVRVRDGETIILGGLLQREQRAIRSKMPILGDIPLIGSLFRSSRRETADTELVIFITPRILSLTGHLPEEEERAIRERMIPEERTAPSGATPGK